MFKPFGNMLKFPDGRIVKKGANGLWIDQNTGSVFNDSLIRDMYYSSLYNTDIPDGGNGKPNRYQFAFDINFLTMTSRTDLLNSGFTHARNGVATYIDSSGVLRYAPHNLFYNTTFSGITKNQTLYGTISSLGWVFNPNYSSAAGATGNIIFNTNGSVGISANAAQSFIRRSDLIGSFGRRFGISVDVSNLNPTTLALQQLVNTGNSIDSEFYIDGVKQANGSVSAGTSTFNLTTIVSGVTLSSEEARIGIGTASGSTGSATFSNFRCGYVDGSLSVPYYENTSTTVERHDPRFDYELYTGRARGLLLEDGDTTMIPSLGYTGAWGRNNINPFTVAVTGPNNMGPVSTFTQATNLTNCGVLLENSAAANSESIKTSYARGHTDRNRTFSVWMKAVPGGLTNASLSVVGGTFAPRIANFSQEGYPVTLTRGTTAANLPSGSTLTAYVVAQGLTSNFWTRVSISRGETLSAGHIDTVGIHLGRIDTSSNVLAGQTLVVAFPQFETGECMTSTIIPHHNTGSNNSRGADYMLMSTIPGYNIANGTFLHQFEQIGNLSGYNRAMVLANQPFNSNGAGSAISIGIYAGISGEFATNPLRLSQPFVNGQTLSSGSPISDTYINLVSGFVSENTPFRLAFMYSNQENYITTKTANRATAIPAAAQSVYPPSDIRLLYFGGLSGVWIRRYWVQSLRYYSRLIPKTLLESWSSS